MGGGREGEAVGEAGGGGEKSGGGRQAAGRGEGVSCPCVPVSPCVPPASVLRPPRAGEPVESIYRRTCTFGMDLSQTKRTTIERPAAPPGLDPNPQRVGPSGGAAREAAAGTLGSISGFPQLLRPKARIRRPFVASILRMSWHQLKVCTADITQFVHGIRILLFARVGVY